MPEKESFTVAIASQPDEDTVILTTAEQIDELSQKRMLAALQVYDNSRPQSGVTFNESSSNTALTVDRIKELAVGVNSSLSNVLEINRFVKQYIAIDDILGATHTAIQSNINTDYRLTYGDTEGRNKQKQLQKAKQIVEQFNRAVHIRRVIFHAIDQTAMEGNYIMYLRTDGPSAVIDTWPLGIAEISEYTMNGDPIVQINLDEFKSRLRKTYTKDRKGKALYFENLDKEVNANFPPEIYKAFKDGEKYAKLDVARTGVLRINNFGGRYGVSHFFKALKPTVRLDDIENADSVNDKAKAKKIIVQLLNKEVMGNDYNRKGFEFAAYAHKELMGAWKNSTVLYTAIPAVRSVEYVEPKVESTPVDKINTYRNEKMVALGVSYSDPSLGSVSAANISLKQLMKTIDSIANQLSDVFRKFYKVMLEENGVEEIYCPDIRVLDSDQMEWEVKKSLVELLFSKLNLSHETCLDLLGMDADDEFAKRQAENDAEFDKTFFPRQSQYTSSRDGPGGRPADSNDPDKQSYDKERSKT